MAPIGVIGGDSATEDEDGGSVSCAECAVADKTYEKWQKDWRLYQHETLAWLVCTVGMALLGSVGYLLLAFKFYQICPLVLLGLGVAGLGFGTWWRARAHVLAGRWFMVCVDHEDGRFHTHNAAPDGVFHHNGSDQPLSYLLIPTPGMRGSPSGKYLRGARLLFPNSSFLRLEALAGFASSSDLKFSLFTLLVKEVAFAKGCLGSDIVVRADYLLAEPDLYLQEGPFNWLRDLKAARAKDEGVFAALTALAECMKNDKRRSPPAADARAVLESLVAVSERHRFWIPEVEKHGDAPRTVEQRVVEIYAKQVVHTRAKRPSTARPAGNT